MIRKQYADVRLAGGALHQTHYRTAGDGPPLVALHPSPMSSWFLTPVIETLEPRARIIAPDTPGYGHSEPLPDPEEGLDQYVAWLIALLDSLGIERAGIYGSATGAQIAIRAALTHPGRVQFLLLENAVHFEDEEREAIMARYFPDLSPRADGSHFSTAWQVATRLFQYFPWFDESDDSRISDAEPPVAAVHSAAMAYLQAGPDYDRAYRAAFLHEDARNLQAVQVPVRLMRWAGGMLRRYADRLDDFEWPDHIRMVHCAASPEARFEGLRGALEALQEGEF